jgi:hypothetical protein
MSNIILNQLKLLLKSPKISSLNMFYDRMHTPMLSFLKKETTKSKDVFIQLLKTNT